MTVLHLIHPHTQAKGQGSWIYIPIRSLLSYVIVTMFPSILEPVSTHLLSGDNTTFLGYEK